MASILKAAFDTVALARRSTTANFPSRLTIMYLRSRPWPKFVEVLALSRRATAAWLGTVNRFPLSRRSLQLRPSSQCPSPSPLKTPTSTPMLIAALQPAATPALNILATSATAQRIPSCSPQRPCLSAPSPPPNPSPSPLPLANNAIARGPRARPPPCRRSPKHSYRALRPPPNTPRTPSRTRSPCRLTTRGHHKLGRGFAKNFRCPGRHSAEWRRTGASRSGCRFCTCTACYREGKMLEEGNGPLRKSRLRRRCSCLLLAWPCLAMAGSCLQLFSFNL
ncbi:hypothetical protein DFH06DRAFT_89068 [Mycena polygramma]|nr:hypothetical protein DFH06DRAFT_89068 [Mycena polygramma]